MAIELYRECDADQTVYSQYGLVYITDAISLNGFFDRVGTCASIAG